MVQLENDRIKEFVLGGNATITIESGKTNRHFTYKVRRSENDDGLYFIKNLRGPDNAQDYVYVGCFYADTKKFVVAKSYRDREVDSWPTSIRAIRYLFNNLDKVPDILHVYHEGRCCRCGRTLTTPESIRKGIGPECEKLN